MSFRRARASSSHIVCPTPTDLLLQLLEASVMQCCTNEQDEVLPLQGQYDAESAERVISVISCGQSAMARHL